MSQATATLGRIQELQKEISVGCAEKLTPLAESERAVTTVSRRKAAKFSQLSGSKFENCITKSSRKRAKVRVSRHFWDGRVSAMAHANL
jgi:hypothetical protein